MTKRDRVTCFQRLCREALADLYEAEQVSGTFEIGECNWGATDGRAAIEAELARKAALFPNPANATLQLRLFSRTPLAGEPPADARVRGHTLEELYDLG